MQKTLGFVRNINIPNATIKTKLLIILRIGIKTSFEKIGLKFVISSK